MTLHEHVHRGHVPQCPECRWVRRIQEARMAYWPNGGINPFCDLPSTVQLVYSGRMVPTITATGMAAILHGFPGMSDRSRRFPMLAVR